MFWRLTPRETLALVDAIDRRFATIEEMRQDAANLRAGVVAATIANVHRRRGTRAVRPTDFFRKPTKPQTIEEMAAVLDRLAARQNRIHRA